MTKTRTGYEFELPAIAEAIGTQELLDVERRTHGQNDFLTVVVKGHRATGYRARVKLDTSYPWQGHAVGELWCMGQGWREVVTRNGQSFPEGPVDYVLESVAADMLRIAIRFAD